MVTICKQLEDVSMYKSVKAYQTLEEDIPSGLEWIQL